VQARVVVLHDLAGRNGGELNPPDPKVSATVRWWVDCLAPTAPA